jgi:hypothetical protein
VPPWRTLHRNAPPGRMGVEFVPTSGKRNQPTSALTRPNQSAQWLPSGRLVPRSQSRSLQAPPGCATRSGFRHRGRRQRPITGVAGCCARAASDQAVAPPSSRRFNSGNAMPPPRVDKCRGARKLPCHRKNYLQIKTKRPISSVAPRPNSISAVDNSSDNALKAGPRPNRANTVPISGRCRTVWAARSSPHYEHLIARQTRVAGFGFRLLVDCI